MNFLLGFIAGSVLGFCMYYVLEQFFEQVRRDRLYLSR